MSLEIKKLSEETRDDFAALLRGERARDWSKAYLDRYIDWRYFARSDWETTLVFVNGQCAAMLDCQLRPYLLGEQTLGVWETSEWFCEEKYRPFGLGIRVVQSVMDETQPLLSVRGTEANQKLLPKLQWSNLSPVTSYTKMLNWRYHLSRITKLKALNRELNGDRPPLECASGNLDSAEVAELIESAAPEAGLTPLVLDWEPAWLEAAPNEIGRFTWLTFRREARLEGLALCRVYDDGEWRRGQILSMYAREHNGSTYAQMALECTTHLRKGGATRIRVRASARAVKSALESTGFEFEEDQPSFWWGDVTDEAQRSSHLMFLRGDDHIRPFLVRHT